MAYKSNIPLSTDSISVSQGDLLGNFQEISTLVSVNHVEFDSATDNQGKHKFVQMPEQAAAPGTAIDEGALYTKQGKTGNTELFFQRENSLEEIEMTGAGFSIEGWTRLPSGILLKWGYSSKTGDGTVTYPTGLRIPVFTAIYSVQLTTKSNSGDPDTFITLVGAPTLVDFNVYGSYRTTLGAKSCSFSYLAIGK